MGIEVETAVSLSDSFDITGMQQQVYSQCQFQRNSGSALKIQTKSNQSCFFPNVMTYFFNPGKLDFSPPLVIFSLKYILQGLKSYQNDGTVTTSNCSL